MQESATSTKVMGLIALYAKTRDGLPPHGKCMRIVIYQRCLSQDANV